VEEPLLLDPRQGTDEGGFWRQYKGSVATAGAVQRRYVDR